MLAFNNSTILWYLSSCSKKLRTFADPSFIPINMTVWNKGNTIYTVSADFLLFFLNNSGKSSPVTNNMKETKPREEGQKLEMVYF